MVTFVYVWINRLYIITFKRAMTFQDNVFVTVVASIQYRAMAEKAADAFYKLSNTKEQIQAYVFDGMVGNLFSLNVCVAK